MSEKGLSPLDLSLTLTLAPPGTRKLPPSSTYAYGPASHDQDAAPVKDSLLPTPASVAKPGSTIQFPQLFRPVERANVRNRGSEPPRLGWLRRDDNGDGCDLSLAPPLQGKGKGKIPAQERYLETKKPRKERSVRVEPDLGQEIKKRMVTAKCNEIKNISVQQFQP